MKPPPKSDFEDMYTETIQASDNNGSTRWEQLQLLAQNAPELPAESVFMDLEIEAVFLLQGKHKSDEMKYPSIYQIVSWIAALGGKAVSSRDDPFEMEQIKKGLERIVPIVIALYNFRQFQSIS